MHQLDPHLKIEKQDFWWIAIHRGKKCKSLTIENLIYIICYTRNLIV